MRGTQQFKPTYKGIDHTHFLQPPHRQAHQSDTALLRQQLPLNCLPIGLNIDIRVFAYR
jgi:hypothetical protein